MNLSPSSKAEEIVARAREFIGSRGYNGFSYADVSAAVGISKASIHHHFPTKAALVHTAVAAYREDARSVVAAIERQTAEPELQLEALIAWLQACVRDRSLSMCVCAMLASEMSELPEDVGAEVRGHFEDLRQWLSAVFERGVALKRFRLGAPPLTEAMSLIATVHGAMVSARAYHDPEVFCCITDALVARLTGSRL